MTETKKVIGLIETFKKNGLGLKLQDTDEAQGDWYNTFDKKKFSGLEKGQEIEIEYVEKVSNGQTFKNIKEINILETAQEMPLKPSEMPKNNVDPQRKGYDMSISMQNAGLIAAELVKANQTKEVEAAKVFVTEIYNHCMKLLEN